MHVVAYQDADEDRRKLDRVERSRYPAEASLIRGVIDQVTAASEK
jgi:hypothetical protein